MKNMEPLSRPAVDPTIDRDFDQTAPHVHATNKPCPTCDPVRTFHDSIDLGARVDEGNTPDSFGGEDFPSDDPELSRRIMAGEFSRAETGEDADAGSREQFARPVSPSIIQFRNQELEKENRRLTRENDAYQLHIKQMEALLQRLATHIDECAQLIAPSRKPQGQFPKAA